MKKEPQKGDRFSNKEFGEALKRAYKKSPKKKSVKRKSSNPNSMANYGPAMARAQRNTMAFGAPNAASMNAPQNPSWVKQKGSKKKSSNIKQKSAKGKKRKGLSLIDRLYSGGKLPRNQPLPGARRHVPSFKRKR